MPLPGGPPTPGGAPGWRVPACSSIRREGAPVGDDDSVGARAGGGAGAEGGDVGMDTLVQVMPPMEKRDTLRVAPF